MAVYMNAEDTPSRALAIAGGLHVLHGERTIAATKLATSSAAAVTNHFSCRRSSPTERRNRTTTALSPTNSGKTMLAANRRPNAGPACDEPNGSCHVCAAWTIDAPVRSAMQATTNHAAGRQRADGRLPVGKRRNRSATPSIVTGGSEFASHAIAWPAGSDPSWTTSAWTA
jgi:hypothetical protein